MTSRTVESQAKTLAIQLGVLKAQIAHPESGPLAGTLDDLYGILADKGSFTEEDIDQAQYAFDWNGVPER